MNTLSIKAPAKVNLQLTITGRRDDGYHLMDSLAVFADLADDLSLHPAPQSSLEISGPFADAIPETRLDDNILGKTIRAFHHATGLDGHYAIRLEKNIPVAAGIGGGSADAAGMLHLLNGLHHDPLDDQDLEAVGLTIGADVPVCLKADGKGGDCWRMQGIGERLSRHELELTPGLVLLNDGIGVSTASVFSRLAESRMTTDGNTLPELPSTLPVMELIDRLRYGNDLLTPALEECPPLRETLAAAEALASADGFIHASMSGSGATCFGLFEAPHQAVEALGAITTGRHWGWAGGLYPNS